MKMVRNKVCGADIHKKFLVATILSREGSQISKRFGMKLDDILKFKEWVLENNCEQVAVESTGVYWVPIHTVLKDQIAGDHPNLKDGVWFGRPPRTLGT